MPANIDEVIHATATIPMKMKTKANLDKTVAVAIFEPCKTNSVGNANT